MKGIKMYSEYGDLIICKHCDIYSNTVIEDIDTVDNLIVQCSKCGFRDEDKSKRVMLLDKKEITSLLFKLERDRHNDIAYALNIRLKQMMSEELGIDGIKKLARMNDELKKLISIKLDSNNIPLNKDKKQENPHEITVDDMLSHSCHMPWDMHMSGSLSYYEMVKADKKFKDSYNKSNGLTADYYKLPPDSTQLQHLINHKNMNANIGEIFRTAYRYGKASHSDCLRDANKIKFYIEAEIERLKNECNE